MSNPKITITKQSDSAFLIIPADGRATSATSAAAAAEAVEKFLEKAKVPQAVKPATPGGIAIKKKAPAAPAEESFPSSGEQGEPKKKFRKS